MLKLEKKMPVLGFSNWKDLPAVVPQSMLDNSVSYKIHGKSLDALRLRGGLSPHEVYWNLTYVDGDRLVYKDDSVVSSFLADYISSYKEQAPLVPHELPLPSKDSPNCNPCAGRGYLIYSLTGLYHRRCVCNPVHVNP